MKHEGVIRNGRFEPVHPKAWKVDHELMEGKKVVVTIALNPPTRHSDISQYYFGFLIGRVAKGMEEFADCLSNVAIHEKLMMAITGSYSMSKTISNESTLIVIRDKYSRYSNAERAAYVEKVKYLLTDLGATF